MEAIKKDKCGFTIKYIIRNNIVFEVNQVHKSIIGVIVDTLFYKRLNSNDIPQEFIGELGDKLIAGATPESIEKRFPEYYLD